MELTASFTRLGTHPNFDRKTAGLEFISLEAGLTIRKENNDGHTFTSKAWVPSVLVPSYRRMKINFRIFSLKGWDVKLLPLIISILKGSGNCIAQHRRKEALTKAPRQLVFIRFLWF